MFHTSQLLTRMRDELPPSNFVEGSATYLEKMAPPRGLELRVQLLDISKPSNVEVLTEQVLRTGWHVPIPFFLRLPKDTSFEGRKLVVAARMVLAHQNSVRAQGTTRDFRRRSRQLRGPDASQSTKVGNASRPYRAARFVARGRTSRQVGRAIDPLMAAFMPSR